MVADAAASKFVAAAACVSAVCRGGGVNGGALLSPNLCGKMRPELQTPKPCNNVMHFITPGSTATKGAPAPMQTTTSKGHLPLKQYADVVNIAHDESGYCLSDSLNPQDDGVRGGRNRSYGSESDDSQLTRLKLAAFFGRQGKPPKLDASRQRQEGHHYGDDYYGDVETDSAALPAQQRRTQRFYRHSVKSASEARNTERMSSLVSTWSFESRQQPSDANPPKQLDEGKELAESRRGGQPRSIAPFARGKYIPPSQQGVSGGPGSRSDSKPRADDEELQRWPNPNSSFKSTLNGPINPSSRTTAPSPRTTKSRLHGLQLFQRGDVENAADGQDDLFLRRHGGDNTHGNDNDGDNQRFTRRGDDCFVSVSETKRRLERLAGLPASPSPRNVNAFTEKPPKYPPPPVPKEEPLRGGEQLCPVVHLNGRGEHEGVWLRGRSDIKVGKLIAEIDTVMGDLWRVYTTAEGSEHRGFVRQYERVDSKDIADIAEENEERPYVDETCGRVCLFYAPDEEDAALQIPLQISPMTRKGTNRSRIIAGERVSQTNTQTLTCNVCTTAASSDLKGFLRQYVNVGREDALALMKENAGHFCFVDGKQNFWVFFPLEEKDNAFSVKPTDLATSHTSKRPPSSTQIHISGSIAHIKAGAYEWYVSPTREDSDVDGILRVYVNARHETALDLMKENVGRLCYLSDRGHFWVFYPVEELDAAFKIPTSRV